MIAPDDFCYIDIYTVGCPAYNTSYTFRFRTYGLSGKYSSWVSVTAKTEQLPLAAPVYSTYSSTSSSVTAYWNTVANANRYWVYLERVSDSFKYAGQWVTSPQATFTGLWGNTEHGVHMYASDSTATYADSPYTYASGLWTNPAPTLSTPSVSSVTSNYISANVSWSAVSGAFSYTVYVYNSNGTQKSTFTTSSTSFKVTGLSVWTDYSVGVQAIGDNGKTYSDSSISSHYTFTTLSNPNPPSFDTSQTGKTDTSITLHWSSVYDSKYTLQYKRRVDATWTTWSSTLTTTSATVTSLTKSTLYDFQVGATVNETAYWTGYSGVVSATPGFRPADWAWTTPKVAGADFSMTAAGWNSFTQRINDFRSYKNLVAYSFTTVASGGTLLASIFNQARNAINELPDKSVTLTVPVVVSGDVVMASYFNNMRDSINSIP